MSWQIIPQVSSSSLENARLQLHHAAQIPAIIARSYLGEHPEDMHANLGWNSVHRALISREIPIGKTSLQMGLILKDLKLLVKTESQTLTYELSGKTWDQALNWISNILQANGLNPHEIKVAQPYGNDLPPFPTSQGIAYSLNEGLAFEALSHFFENTHNLLEEVLADIPQASEIRCWPHHFDIASLIQLDKERSIGVGLSPGDGTYSEPYYYINMWPYPDLKESSLPKLKSGGLWHTQGWVGAVLKASDFLADKNQQDKVSSFIKDAIHHSRKLLSV